MCDTVAKVLERRRELKPRAGALSCRRGNNCNRRIESANGRRLRLVAGLAAFLSVALAPRPTRAASITADGYIFTNFDFSPLTGTAVGSNVNGISNTGQVVGTTVDINNASTSVNFAGTPGALSQLDTGAGQIALGINSAGDVVGGNGTNAFFLPKGGALQDLTTPGDAINAFGINDAGDIVGQYTSGANTPGFILDGSTSDTFTTINQPAGVTADIVNAQGINNSGLVVGFYLGNDGQAHGFFDNAPASPGVITAMPIADPVIPTVAGEPGATFVFSQILGVNDEGIAVGYYGDSTASQHGFLYNMTTGTYTFLDDPAAGFDNGVEVTQITGISDSGEISGFYTDANGVAHGFVAVPTPEPGSLSLAGCGLGVACLIYFRRLRKARAT